jgi:hypothetical protein
MKPCGWTLIFAFVCYNVSFDEIDIRAVKNYRITCSSQIVCSFSASLDFRWKQSLRDYMYSSMLYTVMKSDSSMLILSLRKQMFAEIWLIFACEKL